MDAPRGLKATPVPSQMGQGKDTKALLLRWESLPMDIGNGPVTEYVIHWRQSRMLSDPFTNISISPDKTEYLFDDLLAEQK